MKLLFWETLPFFLPRVRVKIPILGQDMVEGLGFRLKGLQKARHGIYQGIFLAVIKGSSVLKK